MSISVVGFGGGHGLYATLRALNHLKSSGFLDLDISAIVGVSDDGGSSGRLRSELPIVPPGDLRMALAALCPLSPLSPFDQKSGVTTGASESSSTVESLLQYRFTSESPSSLSGHVVGNIILAALWAQGFSIVDGLRIFGQMINANGSVLPASETPTVIKALLRQGADPSTTREVVGQVAVATTTGEVESTFIEPPDVVACADAIVKVKEADILIFGPGSWFTSVTPHLLIPDLRAAIADSTAQKVLVMNLSPQKGETTNYDPCDYLESWTRMAPEIPIDVVIADPTCVRQSDRFSSLAGEHEIHVLWQPVASNTQAHDPQLLAKAFGIVLQMNRGIAWQ